MKNIIAIIALAAASSVAQTNRIATETYVGNKINAVVTGHLARVAGSTITINGETHSVTNNPAWTITAGSSTNTFSVNGRGGLLSTNNAVTLAAGDIGAATLADISAALATNSVTVLTGTNYTEFVKLENGGSLTLWRVVTTGPAWWRYNAEDMGYDDGVVYPAGSNIEWVGFPPNFQPTETSTFSVVNPIGEATIEFFPSGISETKPIWQGTAEDTDTEFMLTPKPDWASTYGSATVTWRSNVTTNLIATFAKAADLAAYITQAQADSRYVPITSGVSTNQTLVNAAATGTLTLNGQPVSATDTNAWADCPLGVYIDSPSPTYLSARTGPNGTFTNFVVYATAPLGYFRYYVVRAFLSIAVDADTNKFPWLVTAARTYYGSAPSSYSSSNSAVIAAAGSTGTSHSVQFVVDLGTQVGSTKSLLALRFSRAPGAASNNTYIYCPQIRPATLSEIAAAGY